MTIKNDTLTFSRYKADECVKLLMAHFNGNSFAEVAYPASIKLNSEEYFLYMFYSCLLDYGMRSKIYHENLIKTYEKYPHLFSPQSVLENYQDNTLELLNIIKNNIHPRYPNVALAKWLSLSEFLACEESLVEKFKKFKSYEEIAQYIQGIKGYGQKTGGLLIRIIYDSNIMEEKIVLAHIPIDRHDIEISYLNSVVNSPTLASKDIIKLGAIWVEAALANSLEPSLLDKYLWTVGSAFCNLKKCETCPL